MKFFAILASTTAGGIGYVAEGSVGAIPWPIIARDRKFFKETTTVTLDPNKKNGVIMGRGTWESLSKEYRPLPGRVNAVISSTVKDFGEGVLVFSSLQDALDHFAEDEEHIENVFVCGGARLYNEAFCHPDCGRVYHTLVNTNAVCNVFVDFFSLLTKFERVQDYGGVQQTGNGLDFYITVNDRTWGK
jgi:dihydrofolate reductase